MFVILNSLTGVVDAEMEKKDNTFNYLNDTLTEIIYITKLKSHDIFWADDIRRYYIILALLSMWPNVIN